MKLTWTLLLQGGDTCVLQVGVSVVSHNGRHSLWSLRMTEVEAETLKTHLETLGIRVEILVSLSNSEQTQERQKAVTPTSEGAVFKTTKCPTCFWLDTSIVGYCGLTEQLLETVDIPLAIQDADTCPLTSRN